MQKKQSEITNYLPSFYTLQLNRNNQEVNHNYKLAADFYRPNFSPHIDKNHQYQQILSPTPKSIDLPWKRNTINDNVQKVNVPIFNTGLSPLSNINSQSVSHKGQNLSFNKNNRFLDLNSNQQQVLNHCGSSQRIQYYNSPQNLPRNFQYGMTKNTDNVQTSINIFNNSPNKTYSIQPKNNSFYFIQPGNQMRSMNQANPQNGRFCQSVIINNIDNNLNYTYKVIQPKGMTIIPNLSVSSNFSDLQTTASSVNLSNEVNANSNLSLPNTPKKPQFYFNQRRNQEIWKSTALFGNLKTKNSQSAARLSTKNSQVLKKPQSKRKQFIKRHFIPQKMENLQKNNKIEVNITKNQQLDKHNGLKFRKKIDLKLLNNNIVNLKESKDNLNQKYSKKTFSIQDFQIIQKLGRGSFGEVFLVVQKSTKFVCVLKALSKKKIKQQKLEQLVFRQIKIQSFLVHKHITSLYGVFNDQNKIYLIMQCMPDSNLASNGKKKITENQTAHLLLQVLDGLQYMHRQDIIHRDIKPQNLFLNNTYLKIGDFGCAVFSDTLRRTIVGCYAYISPEQFQNHPYDQKIDSWSVGILAYQLLTGKPPYEQKLRKIATKNHIQIQNIHQQNIEEGPKIQFSQLAFPKDLKISEEAIDFIKRLLDPDPKTRVNIKEALKHKFLLKAKQYEKYLQTKL